MLGGTLGQYERPACPGALPDTRQKDGTVHDGRQDARASCAPGSRPSSLGLRPRSPRSTRQDREALSEASGENNYRDHMADQGSATFERELDMTLEENVRDALGEVRAALARIDDGTYGTCERCGAEIPAERLEAVPTASLCITCKEAEESR